MLSPRKNVEMVCHIEKLVDVQLDFFKAAYELAVEMKDKVENRP